MDAFIGEVRAFAFGFTPEGWLPCYGQVVNGRQYQALYALIGNTYGGNPQQYTFALPNLQAMAPIGQGLGAGMSVARQMGKTYGTASETLSSSVYLPPHNHTVEAMVPVQTNLTTNMQSTPVANQSWLSQAGTVYDATHFRNPKAYIPVANPPNPPNVNTTFTPVTIGPACANPNGSVSPHSNLQPYLPLTMCICWQGVFPDYN